MASHMRMKLPSLKLTQRSTQGPARQRTVPRGMVSVFSGTKQAERDGRHSDVADHDSSESSFLGNVDSGDGDSNEPSLHFIKQKAAAAAAWEQNRVSMLRTYIECTAPTSDQKCVMCGNEAKYRCLQCAPWVHFCSTCFAEAHRKLNIFHVGEVWEVICSMCVCSN